MKYLLVSLLSVFILLQSFSKLLIVISFEIHQSEIAKTLCVKKDMQDNKCQGKCQLKKYIEEANEQEKNQAPDFKNDRVEILYCNHLMQYGFIYQSNKSNKKVRDNYKNDCSPSPLLKGAFHPPERLKDFT